MALRGLPFSKSMYVFRTEKHNTEVIHSSHKYEVKNKKETNVCTTTRIFKNVCIDVTQKDFYPKSHANFKIYTDNGLYLITPIEHIFQKELL